MGLSKDLWQPIETAPRDGTWFLATGFDYGRNDKPRHYAVVFWEGYSFISDPLSTESFDYLTHWMPLPEAPE